MHAGNKFRIRAGVGARALDARLSSARLLNVTRPRDSDSLPPPPRELNADVTLEGAGGARARGGRETSAIGNTERPGC